MSNDPNIPTYRPDGRARGPSTGRFIQLGEQVILMDQRGNRWPLSIVSIVTSFWGGGDEGVRKLPRPWVYDSVSGEVTVAGDLVVIDFLDGHPGKPIVRGVAAKIDGDRDFFPYNHDEDNFAGNRLAIRLRPIDADGNELGTVELEAGGDDGSVALRATDGVVIEVGPIDAPTATITIGADGSVVVDAPSVALGGTLLADSLVTGTNFCSDLGGVLVELLAALTAGALPDTATTAMITNLLASLTAGAPYLTTKTIAE